MTSNLGTSDYGRQRFGFRSDDHDSESEQTRLRESVNDALKKTFRPEFLNRIEDTITFHPLSQEDIVQIVELMTYDLQNRLDDLGISFELTPGAQQWLATDGFDPVYGARPLRRSLQRHLENPISKRILSGDITSGDNLCISENNGMLEISKSPSKANLISI